MYQLTLSLKERQELVQALTESIQKYNAWLTPKEGKLGKTAELTLKEKIAHLENIKLKVEQARISPVKGLTE